jgi:hypothetical protein
MTSKGETQVYMAADEFRAPLKLLNLTVSGAGAFCASPIPGCSAIRPGPRRSRHRSPCCCASCSISDRTRRPFQNWRTRYHSPGIRADQGAGRLPVVRSE